MTQAQQMPLTTDALIIGAGPIGLFQAFQLGLLEIKCHIVDALPHPGGQCAELYPDKPIYDIPGLPATTGHELAVSLRQQIEPFVKSGAAQLHFGQLVSTVNRLEDGRFAVTTSSGLSFIAKTLFIAAGAGAFVPRKLKVPGLDAFEGTQLFYQSHPIPNLADQHVLIQGDDDVALTWALQFVEIAKNVTLLHRREVFTAAPSLVERMRALCASGQMRFVAGQITAPLEHVADGLTKLTALEISLPDGSSETWPTDVLLVSLGLSPRLGPLADWDLALQRKQLPVDTEKFQTNQPGIFAVGDINTYPGKKKLIVCGFHECVLAAFAAAEIVYPDKAQPLQYTTTSSRLHALLGVSGAVEP